MSKVYENLYVEKVMRRWSDSTDLILQYPSGGTKATTTEITAPDQIHATSANAFLERAAPYCPCVILTGPLG